MVSPRTQANFIIFKTVMGFSPYLTTEFDKLFLPLKKATLGIAQIPPRWQTCVGSLANNEPFEPGFQVAVGAMYVKEFLSPAYKTAAVDMVKNLRSQFKKMLTKEAWMDSKTRAEAEKKADMMESTVGYPKELLDEDLIIQLYSGLKMKNEDSYLRKFVTISKFKKKFLAAEFR